MIDMNIVNGEVYLIQPYVIKFVRDLRQVIVSPDTPAPQNSDKFHNVPTV